MSRTVSGLWTVVKTDKFRCVTVALANISQDDPILEGSLFRSWLTCKSLSLASDKKVTPKTSCGARVATAADSWHLVQSTADSRGSCADSGAKQVYLPSCEARSRGDDQVGFS